MRRIERSLGYIFSNPSLLEEALTHPSYTNENPKNPSYERLEFLGDAVLSLTISKKLFLLPLTPAQMSKIRSYLVSRPVLSSIASHLDIGEEIYLGKGEEKSGGREKEKILASALEALLGAVFLDGGIEKAEEVIDHLFDNEWKRIVKGEFPRDYKSELQELLLARGIYPKYHIVEEDKKFVAKVIADGKVIGSGEGRSKKEATIKAAQDALSLLQSGDKINPIGGT